METPAEKNLFQILANNILPGDLVVLFPQDNNFKKKVEEFGFRYLEVPKALHFNVDEIIAWLQPITNLRALYLGGNIWTKFDILVFLKKFSEFSRKVGGVSLILTSNNFWNKTTLSQAIKGNLDLISYYTPLKVWRTLINEAGWEITIENKIVSPEDSSNFPLDKVSLLGTWINSRFESINLDLALETVIWVLTPVVDFVETVFQSKPVFASILIRTQGNRNELLLEALYSIYFQDCDDYEVLICLVSEDGFEAKEYEELFKLISRLPSGFKSRVRLLVCTSVNRGAPLNILIEAATGEYLCILDDDDLLLQTHLSTLLYNKNATGSGIIYQTFGELREIIIEGSLSKTYPYYIKSITPHFNIPFNFLTHLFENSMPICCAALPRNYILDSGLRFSEDFELGEDWEFFLRASQVLKIITIAKVTALVNLRDNNTNTIGNEFLLEKWQQVKARIHQMQLSQPLLIDGKYMEIFLDAEAIKREEKEKLLSEFELQLKEMASTYQKDYLELQNWAFSLETQVLNSRKKTFRILKFSLKLKNLGKIFKAKNVPKNRSGD